MCNIQNDELIQCVTVYQAQPKKHRASTLFSHIVIDENYVEKVVVLAFVLDSDPSVIHFQEILTGKEYISLIALFWSEINFIAVN